MWKVEVEEYNRAAQDSFPTERLYFRTKEEALDCVNDIKSTGCNCSIWLIEMIKDPEYPGAYMGTDNIECLQSIVFD